jgi:hypothetical protein
VSDVRDLDDTIVAKPTDRSKSPHSQDRPQWKSQQ